MVNEDKEKTTFITSWATYQKAMVTLFHNMMHKEIEVYVDNMIAKSRERKNYFQNLRKLFQRLIRYQLKLNFENSH